MFAVKHYHTVRQLRRESIFESDNAQLTNKNIIYRHLTHVTPLIDE